MIERSRGIVLQYTKYGDTSLIVRVFSEQNGLQSFLIKGAYGRHSKFRPAFFQPLTLIDFVSRTKVNRDLQFMTEVAIETPFMSIPFDAVKSSIVFYISELLTKTIVENTANKPLFDFIHGSMLWLDLCNGSFNNFHLHFSIELSKYLGFRPRTEPYKQDNVFDLMNGVFKDYSTSIQCFIPADLCAVFKQLCETGINNIDQLPLQNESRRALLQHIITYYQLHVAGFKGLKSQEVLKVVLE